MGTKNGREFDTVPMQRLAEFLPVQAALRSQYNTEHPKDVTGTLPFHRKLY